jgi:hypothetical protein
MLSFMVYLVAVRVGLDKRSAGVGRCDVGVVEIAVAEDLASLEIGKVWRRAHLRRGYAR